MTHMIWFGPLHPIGWFVSHSLAMHRYMLGQVRHDAGGQGARMVLRAEISRAGERKRPGWYPRVPQSFANADPLQGLLSAFTAAQEGKADE